MESELAIYLTDRSNRAVGYMLFVVINPKPTNLHGASLAVFRAGIYPKLPHTSINGAMSGKRHGGDIGLSNLNIVKQCICKRHTDCTDKQQHEVFGANSHKRVKPPNEKS